MAGVKVVLHGAPNLFSTPRGIERIKWKKKMETVTLKSEAGHTIKIPFMPSEVQIDNLASVYATIERPFKKELLVYQREQLTEVTFTAYVAADQTQYPLGPVEKWLIDFREHVRRKTRWRMTGYGRNMANMWWRITDASIASQLRSPENNDIAAATVDIRLTEANDLNIRTGPVTGGVTTAPTVPAATVAPAASGIEVTIRSAKDTLWALAQQYLGNGNRWPEIAAFNGITNPAKIHIGQVIKIPKA